MAHVTQSRPRRASKTARSLIDDSYDFILLAQIRVFVSCQERSRNKWRLYISKVRHQRLKLYAETLC